MRMRSVLDRRTKNIREVTVVVTMDSERVVLTGCLDGRSVEHVRSALHWAIDESSGNLVVDLSDVEYIDAVGLGVLAAAHRRIERDGRHLVLSGCRPAVRRMLSVTRLTRVLHLDRSYRQA
jgi:anti-anti-sigma factor